MTNKFIYTALFVISFAVACVSYDSAKIYHKNFVCGTHPLLRFNGYYSDTLYPGKATATGSYDKPVFLYSNGTTFSCEVYVPVSALKSVENYGKVNYPNGSWGNFLVGHDTITLEKFQKEENDYTRIIMKGLIKQDEIRWFSRKRRNDPEQSIDYSIYFHEYKAKPDSTQNYTRIWPKYNH